MNEESKSIVNIICYISSVYILISRIIIIIILVILGDEFNSEVSFSGLHIPVSYIIMGICIINIFFAFILFTILRTPNKDQIKHLKQLRLVSIFLLLQLIWFTVIGIILIIYTKDSLKIEQMRDNNE